MGWRWGGGGDVRALKGQSRQLCWSGLGGYTGSDCVAFAVRPPALLHYYLDILGIIWIMGFYYLQRIGLLSGPQGTFLLVALLAFKSLARPVVEAGHYLPIDQYIYSQTVVRSLPTSKLLGGVEWV